MTPFFKKTMYVLTVFWIFSGISWAKTDSPQPKAETKTALITGASRGIGFALVQQLLEDNIHVIAIVRNKASLEALTQKYPHHLDIIQADLSSPEGILSIQAKIKAPRIDYLVHNAAVIEPLGKEALINASPEALQKILTVNLMAPVLLTASLKDKLTKGSRILNVSSRAGEKAYPGLSMYCITKAGLDMHTTSLQLDKPLGILAAFVHPGEVETGIQGNLRDHDVKEFPYAVFFQQNLAEKKLMPAETSAKFLKWLLVGTADDYFVSKKHDIYEPDHHLSWYGKVLPNPYR